MMLVKDLKRLLDTLPDNAPAVLGGCYGCDIESVSYSTLDGLAHLELTEGYSLTLTDFINGLMGLLPRNGERNTGKGI